MMLTYTKTFEWIMLFIFHVAFDMTNLKTFSYQSISNEKVIIMTLVPTVCSNDQKSPFVAKLVWCGTMLWPVVLRGSVLIVRWLNVHWKMNLIWSVALVFTIHYHDIRWLFFKILNWLKTSPHVFKHFLDQRF